MGTLGSPEKPVPGKVLIGGMLLLGLGTVTCDGGSEPLSEPNAAKDYADEVCALLSSCHCLTAEEVTQCREAREVQRVKAYEAARRAGLSFDGACARRNLDDLTSMGCASDVPETEPSACAQTCLEYHGTKTKGEACSTVSGTMYSDCAQGLLCRTSQCTSPCDSTNQDGLSKGDPCSDGDEVVGFCSSGLVCDVGGSNACVDAPQEGHPCIDGKCDEGLWCQTLLDESTCQPRLGGGESCVVEEACQSFICLDGVCAPTEPVSDRPAEGQACQGPCVDGFLCDEGTCVAAPYSDRGAAVCTLGVDGNSLKDAPPPGSCDLPIQLPGSKDIWVAFSKNNRENTVDGSCARNGETDVVFAYTPPSNGLLLLSVDQMFLNRGALYAQVDCGPWTEDTQTLACDARGDKEEEFLSFQVKKGQALKLVLSDPQAIEAEDGVLRLRLVSLPGAGQEGLASSECATSQPLTLEPSGELLVARTTGSLDCTSKEDCQAGARQHVAVTTAQNAYLHVVAVPSSAEQRLLLSQGYDCSTFLPPSHAPSGGQASARYRVDGGLTTIIGVNEESGVGGDFELLVVVEPR